MTPSNDFPTDPSSAAGESPMPFSQEAVSPSGETRPRCRGGSPLRWIFWGVVLGTAAGLWAASRFQPKVLETLASGIASLTTRSIPQAQQEAEQAAGEAIRQAGALVIFEGPDQGVTSVYFMTPGSLTEESLARLEALVRLCSLNLTDTPITDRQLSYVAKVRSLASLVLNKTPVTDAGLAALAELEQLEVLHLRKTSITDAGLVHLVPLRALKVLDLSETQVTDRGLAELAKLHQLQWLLLEETAITDAGLVHLEGLPRLRQLTIRGTQVTDAGVARLKEAIPGLHVDR